MCLEDRFLFALYNQTGFVALPQLAESISITEHALFSIVHRVQKGYPHFLVMLEGDGQELQVSPNAHLQKEVRLFLAGGGFTEANEQELRDYYAQEMNEWRRTQKAATILNRYNALRWLGGTALVVALGAALRAALKRAK